MDLAELAGDFVPDAFVGADRPPECPRKVTHATPATIAKSANDRFSPECALTRYPTCRQEIEGQGNEQLVDVRASARTRLQPMAFYMIIVEAFPSEKEVAVIQPLVLVVEGIIMEVLNVAAILVAGLMVGCELAVAVFIHPTLDKLPDEAHLAASSALARVLGTVMPFWYALACLLILAEAIIGWRQSGVLSIWFASSAILWILVIVYTITTLVPINNRIASWEKSTPPADWKSYRSKWDMHHRWRVVLLTIAFAFLVVGIL